MPNSPEKDPTIRTWHLNGALGPKIPRYLDTLPTALHVGRLFRESDIPDNWIPRYLESRILPDTLLTLIGRTGKKLGPLSRLGPLSTAGSTPVFQFLPQY